GDSLYNFIITTPNRHEYLYALADYLKEHQTGNFIANKIFDIIKKLVLIEIIHNDYSQILNIHCVAHALNLLTADLVKTISIKEILKQANMLIAFFQKPHLASRLLYNTISSINIKDGSLETYSKTRWVSIYDTTNSIILEEKPDIFTNQEVFKIICDEDDIFYTSCKRISLIFKPIKKVINLLESHMASLADCFMGIVQIAIALKKILTSNNFRTLAITVFNFHYQQLDIFPYILTYFLHPNYRNQGLKKGKFLEICEMATEYYKEVHHNDKECHEHTDLQKLAKTMFAIIPSQANCKRNFSILKWFTKGQSIVQLYSYYISNVEKELNLRDDFAEIELHLAANDITMALQDLVDLSDPIFGADNNQEEPIFTDEETSMEFDSRSLVWDMLSDGDLYE
ncbi:4630_t:CDS:2, partial [Gigaspora margarita]